jgi:WD40 repeat protein
VVAVGLLSTYCIGLFDAKTGREVGRIPLGDTVVAAAMFSPDGAYLACDVDLHVALLDARTHTPLWTVDGWPGMFSPDGKSLTLWSSWRGPVNFYEVESGRLLSSHGGLTSEVAAWTLCDHGARLVTHEANGAVVLRDVTDGTATATICAPQCPSNRGIAAGADRIVTTAADGGLTFWDTRIPSVPWVVPTFFQVFSSAISATGSVLVSGGWGEVTRYDVDTGAPLWSSLVSRGSIRVLAISPDDRYIAATGEKHDLILIDANTGARVYTVPLGPAEVRALAWSPDGKRIFAGGDGKNLEIRSTQNGEVVAKLPGQRGPIRGIAVSPDGLKLVSVSGTSGASEGALQIWDLQSNRLLHDVRDHGPAMTCVAYNADGTQIAVGSEDLTVTLWSSSGEKLATLSGTSGIPTSVRFGPAKTRDEKARVLASTQDGKIHVWNSSTADEILTLRASSRQLFAAAISPDEHVLLAGGETIAVLAFETKPPVSGNGGRDHVRSARKWMEAAVHELDLAEDVVQRLEEQPDLPDDMRRTAMQFARVRGDHVNWLNSESWGIVARTNASQEVYQRARRISARACELWPDDYALLNTRGIAEYRAADYPAALATLQRCDTMGQALRGSSQPEDVIFLAMTHAQRGEIAEARHQLERAERIVMERPDRGGSECQNFLREAQELITALH